MTARPGGIMPSTEERVASYVRSTMRVELPAGLADDIMRSAAQIPQHRHTWFSALGPMGPAMAAVAVTALILAVGLFLVTPRNVGPPPAPTPTPAPTLTPANARVLAEPGDVIRIPALDGEGQFGTITIERASEKAGYEGFVPIAFGDVFFLELYVTYEPERVTLEQYGEWEFAFTADLNRDGFDDGDAGRLQRGVGFLGLQGMPGFESAPQPLLQGMRGGDEVLEGWLVLELPAEAADFDLYLVYGHGEWTNGIDEMEPDLSALLRPAGDPVGVTVFDVDAFPTPGPSDSPVAMPSTYAFPSPMPSPAATFEPSVNTAADELMSTTQSCTNPALDVRVTFPASWYTNEAYEDLPTCMVFASEPIQEELINSPLGSEPAIRIQALEDWIFGIEEPTIDVLPIGERLAWRITYSEDQQSYGTHHLIPVTDDPYGPFLYGGSVLDEGDRELGRAVLERMLLALEFNE